MSIIIKEVVKKSDIKNFINLQFDIYKNSPMWVPPIKADEKKALSPKTNPAFEFCDARFFLAYKDGKLMGRIGGIINKAYNEKMGKKYGRINRIEFYDDAEVFDALMDKITTWFKEEGIEFIHGPLGFTNLDTQGLQIEGFDYLTSIGSVYHLEYYQHHFNRLGFEKENDWVEFILTLGEEATKKGIRGAKLIKRRYGFEVLKFDNIEDLKPYGEKVFDILNDAFKDLPYVTPFTGKLRKIYSEKYFKLLNPKFVRIIKKDDELVAFVIGFPNLSKAMRKANGKLFPFGFKHILKDLKNPETIDLMLTGVMEEYHSSGAAVILFAELQEEMMNAGLNTMETTGIFESNHSVINNWKNYEHNMHKRRRCYVKSV